MSNGILSAPTAIQTPDQMNAVIRSQKRALVSLNALLGARKTESEARENELVKVQAELSDTHSELETLRKDLAAAHQQIQAMGHQSVITPPQAPHDISTYEKQIADLRGEVTTLQGQVTDIDAMRKTLTTITQERDRLAANIDGQVKDGMKELIDRMQAVMDKMATHIQQLSDAITKDDAASIDAARVAILQMADDVEQLEAMLAKK